MKRRWPFLPGRKKQQRSTLPLGAPGRLPWHCTVGEAKRILRELSALSPDIDGRPTARLRWGKLTLHASLEFVAGIQVGKAWLASHPGAILRDRDNRKITIQPRLRAANIHFPERDPRGNWAKALEVLGQPTRNEGGEVWCWEWEDMHVHYSGPGTNDQGISWLRFEATPSCEVLEIRNQSSLELFECIRLRVDFDEGSWEMADAPATKGVPVRLHWDVPSAQRLLVTVSAAGREIQRRLPASQRKIVLTSDGNHGVRVVT